MEKTMRLRCVLLMLVLVPATAFAEDAEEIETEAETDEIAVETGTEPAEELLVSADRPSFSAGAGTVAAGHVQFELGADVATTDGGAVLTFPQLFIRAGVAENMELRLGVPSYSAGLGVDDPGAGATEFSLKIGGSIAEGLDLGALPYVRLSNYGDGGGDHSLGFLALVNYGLTDTVGMFSNVGLGVVPGTTGTNVFELAASLGGSLALGDSFGIYIEAFLTQADDDPNAGVNAGASYLIAPWIGIDAYAGAGLSGSVSDVFGGLGVSILR